MNDTYSQPRQDMSGHLIRNWRTGTTWPSDIKDWGRTQAQLISCDSIGLLINHFEDQWRSDMNHVS